MDPQLVEASRWMRLVVLVVFIGWLLSDPHGVRILFAAVCGVFLVLTVFQLWSTHQDTKR
ncbi:hypothetical protein CHEID_04845 [Corynebacterium heidelbergense]|uniref:Uncharacterized protein n=1 Tax=Corynebacterium heidelbergense TaxID=2055947 RepID=A0A364VAF5_9CORY|nr:hypothetical protein CWC39_07665 [Corynebacterium heidelbergense]WCZ36512.1 hypothetical protein CHEID_04845 [Corynebacterium heidelbergense]